MTGICVFRYNCKTPYIFCGGSIGGFTVVHYACTWLFRLYSATICNAVCVLGCTLVPTVFRITRYYMTVIFCTCYCVILYGIVYLDGGELMQETTPFHYNMCSSGTC